ncbi:hypothetical protein DPMN_089021 [Dreissena polymorpha]|uniref:Laminin N-terminal domain-containing protein n=1 Tax=Dreissena polymorpha TaxID=45954 RepID=A0A9D4QX21_DREPO|nr:hypothetical protein DPMN_089021 [Dreissena polymorpha]
MYNIYTSWQLMKKSWAWTSTFQVFYVMLLFYSPLPLAVEIQRKPDNKTVQWLPWQQFASNCQLYFNAVDNGPLPTPTSINCVKINQK